MSDKQNHKRWRKQFNEDCLNRDGHRCLFCGVVDNLDVHHITDRHQLPNGGYAMSNGITVCERHHLLCEEWNQYGVCRDGFWPTDLYQMINSSHDKAFNDSQKLT